MPREHLSTRVRDVVRDRANGRCEYCFTPLSLSSDPFSIDHIKPRTAGGSSSSANLAWSCQGCNSYKQGAASATDPVSGKLVRLFNPRKDQWRTHFEWIDDPPKMLGLTAIGRATIDRLQLNRTGVVNLRRVMRDIGMHPPPRKKTGE